ncbi:uncharacterized protein LOC134192951 [Corticium candelabrum]|uniref:uncharacterized protein LOC134192951 n=1 Tax=Corticium candelabrum TaxID=121492 RepID=UPI002E276C8F|nr:uncharacterized protein LOC134192951 [Corticium candelabrum]
MEDEKNVAVCELEYGESKTRITCLESDGVRMVPLPQISSHLLPPMSQPTLDKRMKQLGEALTRRKASQRETRLLKEHEIISPRAFAPWLIPLANLDNVLPFLESGGRCAGGGRRDEEKDPRVRSEELKRRLARALCRLESDFHDTSPLSVKSISSCTGVRASSMRAGFFSSHNQNVKDALSGSDDYDKHSTADEMNGFLHNLPKTSSSLACSDVKVRNHSDVELSGSQKELSDEESEEAIIAISNDCESSALPLSHCLWDLEYIEENGYCDLVETDECEQETDDPDFTLSNKKWIGPSKIKQRCVSEGRENKQISWSTGKTSRSLVNRTGTYTVEDHAAMKREYDAIHHHYSTDNLKTMKSSLKAKLEKKSKRKRAKQLLERAHRTKAMAQQKQTVKPLVKERSEQRPTVESSKPTQVPDVRTVKTFRPFSAPRRNFCLKDIIPSHSFLVVDVTGELDVRYPSHIEPSETASQLPSLCHPIWNWQVGQPFSENSKRIIIRRVKLTTVPPPPQDPTKSRSKPRKLMKTNRKKVKYSPLAIA